MQMTQTAARVRVPHALEWPRTLLLGVLALLVALPAHGADVRVKDMARIQGVRDNELFGYGLIIGLNGTGDSTQTVFTVQSVVNMLQRLGVNVPRSQITVKNVAAVVVTAKLPPFAKPGTTVDVQVSSMGDATTLQGGVLLMTPLQAADGKVYAVAQGAISIGGFVASGGAAGNSVTKNHPTAGRVPNGAIIEREVPMAVVENQTLAMSLNNPDFTTAGRLADVVNSAFGEARARAEDAATIRVAVRPGEELVPLIARLESLRVVVDQVAKVVINERTGTIIMGSDVRLSTVAIAHGNLSVQIKTDYNASQPAPFANKGRTVVTPQTDVGVKEDRNRLSVIPEGASIGDLVQGLNALGVTSRDLISILQAIKQAGGLQAELEIL
ncbi:MAG TPA: flagellar basal body P-ring protein FlgI [Candidatus Baltobacteraceae bacterium]|nr:flagellar basal body P-ring protein FlgI [Candidatus Baltobacteraceae bacterium]